MLPRYILGVDYSLTSPGVCLYDTHLKSFKLFFVSDKKKLLNLACGHSIVTGFEYPLYRNDLERYINLSNWVMSLIPDTSNVHVIIEGYSYGSTSARLFQIAENAGCLKLQFHNKNIPFTVVPPTTIKKLATGKGNSKKEPVYEAFVEKTGIDLKSLFETKAATISSPISDLSDSYWMAQWGLIHLQESCVQ